jgi:CDP-diacylglycerol--serine O-phosphatidyltransferase
MGIPLVPTLLTLGNGVCGLASASYAAQASAGEAWPLIFAGLLIFVAMVFDVLDGGVARLLRQTSRFGGELESLCDAVSFGVAPALVLIRLGADFYPALLWAIAALYLVAVLLRLARFNLEAESDDRHEWFTGLPSPAAGGMIASLAIVAASGWPFWLPAEVTQLLPAEASMLRYASNAAPWIALLLAALMVSWVPYPHTVNQIVRGKRKLGTLILVAIGVATAAVLGAWSATIVLAVFVIGSPLKTTWLFWTRPQETTGPQPVLSRFRFRARRGEPPSNGHGKATPLSIEKKSSEERVRLSKSRKVRM